jgi:hypothetical protein
MRIATLLVGVWVAAPAALAQDRAASWSGTLLDAGCADRSVDNLRAQPTGALAVSNEPQKMPQGIRVAPGVVKAERARATLPDTPDHASRYSNAGCALTADTKAFMLLLPDDTLLNLDEGGNTLAFEAFQATPAGQAILNGKVGGLKPQATLIGIRAGDRLKARSVELRRPQQTAPAK